MQAPWLYLIETDYLFVKPVAAPGPAESAVRPLGFFFSYVYAAAPVHKVGRHAQSWRSDRVLWDRRPGWKL
jgi:hypothetical protein